jgi:hypothetical protein
VKAIPEEIINQVPDKVTPDRESCEYAADKGLLLLFMLGSQAASPLTFPPIISSNGHELWPLPPPWASDEEKKRQLIENLNGDPETNQTGLLSHVKTNARAYNAALESGAIPEAERIVAMTPGDSSSLWSDLNAFAASITDEDIFQTLQLSGGTKVGYRIACGISFGS